MTQYNDVKYPEVQFNYTQYDMPQHEAAKCWLLKGVDGERVLQSYGTYVAGLTLGVDGVPKSIWCKGLYSPTTIRHIGWFARLYGLTYYDFKGAVGKGVIEYA